MANARPVLVWPIERMPVLDIRVMQVNNTVIHVTTAPSEALIRKNSPRKRPLWRKVWNESV
jgi:hypothetical protein